MSDCTNQRRAVKRGEKRGEMLKWAIEQNLKNFGLLQMVEESKRRRYTQLRKKIPIDCQN